MGKVCQKETTPKIPPEVTQPMFMDALLAYAFQRMMLPNSILSGDVKQSSIIAVDGWSP